MNIPLSLAELIGSVVGLAVWSWFVAQWAKNALGDWRWTNWVTLGIVVATGLIGRVVLSKTPTAEEIMWQIILGVMATSLETFGYEAVSNGLGMLGKGSRSDVALREQAIYQAFKK